LQEIKGGSSIGGVVAFLPIVKEQKYIYPFDLNGGKVCACEWLKVPSIGKSILCVQEGTFKGQP
jgi:hypothetical protein